LATSRSVWYNGGQSSRSMFFSFAAATTKEDERDRELLSLQ
jgi:hypothetical protein